MQLHSQTAELRALLTITSKNIPEEKRTLWLGKLNKDMFHTPVCKYAFERVDKLAKKRFKIISFKSLVEDPSLDEDMRDLLANTKEKPCNKGSQWKETLETLAHYRKLRIIYDSAVHVLESMEQPAVDVDELFERTANALARAQSDATEDEFFLHFGANDTSNQVIEDICNNAIMPRITTGYTEYDTRSGGFPVHGVVFLASTTSGGKSTLAMNICRHMYMVNNMSTFRLTLEMQELQETQRLLSHITKIPLKRFTQAKLTAADKRLIRKKHKAFVDHGKKYGINYTTLSPKGGMNMHDAIRMAKPFGYKVLVVDYIGLLDEGEEEQWKSLMEAARIAKNYSRQTGTLVILLAQLDDEKEKLRYARGMKEHADVVWQWNYSKPEQRELKIIPIVISKDRDAELFAFELDEHYDVMTASNRNEGGGDTIDFEEEETKPSKSKKGKKSKKAAIHDDADDGTRALS